MDIEEYEAYLQRLHEKRYLSEQDAEDRALDEMDEKWYRAQDIAEEMRYMPVQRVNLAVDPYINPAPVKLSDEKKALLSKLKVSVNGFPVDNTHLHVMPYFQTLMNGNFAEKRSGAVDISIPEIKKNTEVIKAYFDWIAILAKGRNVEAAFKKLYDPSIIHIAHHFGDQVFLGPSVTVSSTNSEVIIKRMRIASDGKHGTVSTLAFKVRPGFYYEEDLMRIITQQVQKTVPCFSLSADGNEYAAASRYPCRGAGPIVDVNIFGNGIRRLPYHIPSYDAPLLGDITKYPQDYMELLLNEYIDQACCYQWRESLYEFTKKRNIAEFLWNSSKEDLVVFFEIPSNEIARLVTMDFKQLEAFAKSNHRNITLPPGMSPKDAARAVQLLELIRKRQLATRQVIRSWRQRRVTTVIYDPDDGELAHLLAEYNRLLRIPLQ